jgi:hypothetical protein
MNAYIVLDILTFFLIVPISIIIVYLGKHLKDKNGEIGLLRKIILIMKIGWIIYLLGHLTSTYLLSLGFSTIQVLPILISTILPIMSAHWWALMKLRKLL